MKISLKWIKDYVASGLSVDALIHRLTMAGIEAEKVEKAGDDTVIEFEITPNRPDCLSMIGIAREIAAVANKPLQLPKISKRKAVKTKCDVAIDASESCRRYIGTVIEGISVKAAEKSIQERLKALGNRPISNIVDITNFCLFETGQPLHAFDLDKLEGKKIIVRFAKKNEKITTLDGMERELDPSVLVIADAKRPVALAGIMGGANSEVSASTKNILLESAYFDPVLIRRTARKLGLTSDSAYRFERGVVYEHVKRGSDRATDLILASAGGTVTRYADVKAGATPRSAKAVNLSLTALNDFLGAAISKTEVKRILKSLGFSITLKNKDVLSVTPPCFRADVDRREDLYEEVSRIVGYDKIPQSFPTVKLTDIHSNPRRIKRLKIADLLLSQGFNEVLTYSLLSRDAVSAAGVERFSHMDILNPLSKEQEVLRPHLLPSLLQVVHTNSNRGQKDLAFFETGKTYPHGGEKEALGVIMTGCLRYDWRQDKACSFDFFDLKGSIQKMLSQLGLDQVIFCAGQEEFLEEGQTAKISVGKRELGVCGKVEDRIIKNFGMKQSDVFFAQIDLEAVYQLPLRKKKYHPICEYPAITRDVSIAIAKDVAFADVCRIVKEFGSEHLAKIEFKEEYLGDKIAQGQRGLVFSVIYQSSKRTLTEEEIQAAHDVVCQQIVDQLGATIR